MLHFTGFGLEIFWTMIYNYTYILDTLLTLDLKILGLQIWIMGFELENTWVMNLDFDCCLWIWTWNYLDCDLGL